MEGENLKILKKVGRWNVKVIDESPLSRHFEVK